MISKIWNCPFGTFILNLIIVVLTSFISTAAESFDDVECDYGWVSLKKYQPLKTKGRDHFTCLWFASEPGDWFYAHKVCGSQFARIVEPQDKLELEALREYISLNISGSIHMGIWSGMKYKISFF